MIDSHCHLDLSPLCDDVDSVLAQAAAVGVTQLLVPAVSRLHWAGLQQLSARSQVRVAIGLHPCFSHQADADIAAMTQRLESVHPFIAIGECGLDKVEGKLPLEQQLWLCQQQLLLAVKHHLPVILHVRNAHNELLQLLRAIPLPAGGVVHGFSGSFELAMQYVRHNLLIGVGGVITYERAQKTRKTVSLLPLDKIIFETDSPDMPLSGNQGKANHPHHLLNIVTAVASIRPESEQRLIHAHQKNCNSLFQLNS
ncbi:TatD family hydrolase [Ferrimonas lipolytica]|uniref:TatD family hydrolase n=1 Tax=Ferrimonas lipolytica TaxID=2724191 RepID=A0A6H1UA61_9GAMM|nr:TatD family hydrolase [Ferrimonas lipolytica]QIZ75937.1 TatD family hydrolase [Ferrimonas lipolytica]